MRHLLIATIAACAVNSVAVAQDFTESRARRGATSDGNDGESHADDEGARRATAGSSDKSGW